MLTSTLYITNPLILSVPFTFLTFTSLSSFLILNPYFSANLLFMDMPVAPLSNSVFTDTSSCVSIFSKLISIHTSLSVLPNLASSWGFLPLLHSFGYCHLLFSSLRIVLILPLLSFSSYCQKYNIKCIYSTSQMSKLSLTLHTFSVTGSVAGLFLTLTSSFLLITLLLNTLNLFLPILFSSSSILLLYLYQYL